MKLVLQIAAGIVLAFVIAAASVGAYKYEGAQIAEAREADARSVLGKLTPAVIASRCGAPIAESTERVGNENWVHLEYLSPANFKPVDLTVTPLYGMPGRFFLYKFGSGDVDIAGSADRLAILPCLARESSAESASR
jgi:hypothetical protein